MNTIQTFTQEVATRGAVDWVAENETLVSQIILGLIIAMLVVAVLTVVIQKKFHEKNAASAIKQNATGKTGAQIAKEILAKNGITDVQVVQGREGQDHFDPTRKVVSLSPSTFNSSSISAMAIAAHEVGHAIQWNKKSIMVRVRNVLQTPVQIAAGVGQMMFAMGGIFFMLIAGLQTWMFWITIAGLITYAAMGIFQLITLPIEFDASRRAMKNLKQMGFFGGNAIVSEKQIEGSKDATSLQKAQGTNAGITTQQMNMEHVQAAKGVLRAAAMTYVIAFVSTMITLAFFLLRLLLILANNRN